MEGRQAGNCGGAVELYPSVHRSDCSLWWVGEALWQWGLRLPYTLALRF